MNTEKDSKRHARARACETGVCICVPIRVCVVGACVCPGFRFCFCRLIFDCGVRPPRRARVTAWSVVRLRNTTISLPSLRLRTNAQPTPFAEAIRGGAGGDGAPREESDCTSARVAARTPAGRRTIGTRVRGQGSGIRRRRRPHKRAAGEEIFGWRWPQLLAAIELLPPWYIMLADARESAPRVIF